jgi:F1F0 ATPase subunit 2
MTVDPENLALAAAAGIAGAALGWAHFASLAWVADLFAAGRIGAVALQVGRLAVLSGFLWLCAQGGAAVLLAAAAGVLAGRSLVLRRAR